MNPSWRAQEFRRQLVDEFDRNAEAWFEAVDRTTWLPADYELAVQVITELVVEDLMIADGLAAEAGEVWM